MDVLAANNTPMEGALVGTLGGAAFMIAGVLLVRFARFLQSLPADERDLEPRRLETTYWIKHPRLIRAVAVVVILAGAFSFGVPVVKLPALLL